MRSMSTNMARGKRKLMLSAAVALTLIVGGTASLITATDASASTGCKSSPYTATFKDYGPGVGFPETPDNQFNYRFSGAYKTTSQCKDINMKNTSSTHIIKGCVSFGASNDKCNYWTIIQPGYWGTIATNVKDGTTFQFAAGAYAVGQYEIGANGYVDA
jgi:hypothetical protein